MLIQPTLDALNRLKLHGMALALSEQMTNTAAQQLAFEERIALLLEREVSHRQNRRMGRLWTACQPRIRAAVIEDLDYRGRGGLDRAQLASLASCEWIRTLPMGRCYSPQRNYQPFSKGLIGVEYIAAYRTMSRIPRPSLPDTSACF